MKKDTNLQSLVDHINIEKRHEVERVVSGLEDDLLKERVAYKSLLEDYNDALARLKEMDSLSEIGVKPRPISPVTPTGKGEATALIVLSDVHPFNRVRPQTVNGLNKYSPEISEIRQRNFWQRALRLVEIERSGQYIPNLLVHFGGDMVGNTLHDDAKETNSGTVQEEMKFQLEQLESGLDFMWKNGKFKWIRVVCSSGNHDRDTKFKQHENQTEHSFAHTIYYVLKRDYAKRRGWNVTFDLATGYHCILDVYGRKIRFHHGDDIRFAGGVGGLSIPVNKAIDRWNISGHVDLDVFGHWHTSLHDPRFIINGSVIGYTAYALSQKLPFELPRQTFALLDKKRWLTSYRYIYLD
jgi:hypothetical protein